MDSMAYVAYCKCGKMIFAVVEDPDSKKDNAKDVGRMIKQGFTVQHISCEQVRSSAWCENRGKCNG